jgi:RNA polymerase primary sigma factor
MRQLKITNKITTRESLALDKYLNDIGKIDMLNAVGYGQETMQRWSA